jgi:AmmeMemoRadiSam system protein A
MDIDYYTTGEKEFLLKIARKSIEEHLLNGVKFEPQTVNKKMWEKYGVFVSLFKNGDLCGCVGSVSPTESLILSVRDNIIRAANDSRSEPLGFRDIEDMKIEISILSELERVKLGDIRSGDGVLLKHGKNSATYLPSVWGELKTKDKFLASLAEKAGLDANDYKDPKSEFWTYDSVVFGDK